MSSRRPDTHAILAGQEVPEATTGLHFLSILDFWNYCNRRNIAVEKAYFIGSRGKVTMFPNLFAQTGIFVITGGTNSIHTTPAKERDNARQQ